MVAEDGQAAVELLAEAASSIDFVLFDLKMPRMDGLVLHAKLDEQWPDKPACLMTGNLQDPDALAIVRSGVRALQKPFRLDDVIEVLNSMSAPTP